MHVGITLFPGFDELDAIAPYEVLQTARSLGLDITVDLVTHAHQDFIQASHGLQVGSLTSFKEDSHYDLLIIPGGDWISGKQTGVRLAVKEGILPSILRERYSKGTILASVCTGAFLLAEAGVLKGRPAITHHMAVAMLRERGIQIVEERVVDAGSVLTSGGVTSGFDLSLWIIERFFGVTSARAVEDYLEYRRQGKVFQVSSI